MSYMDKFEQLQVESADGDTKIPIHGMYKDMTIAKFKAAVSSRIPDPRATAKSIQLFSLGEEMSNVRTLRSYDLTDSDIITFVYSDVAPSLLSTTSSATETPPSYSSSCSTAASTTDTIIPQNATAASVFVKDMRGKTHSLRNMPLSSTIGDLLLKLKQQASIDTDHVLLIYGGKPLNGGGGEKDLLRTLVDVGIKDQCTIQGCWKEKGGVTID
ncbi:hypothetical protein K402DRAFT_466348 [Aulographum hederae CBS 113979]|uniref:Ubiquitin-like domain-containing protein n=1 Tax=Aulographum hederae CBS 113979 TaxID=1176131 RepID=A0A6G1GQL9_9PEZI|nr:hypothetical protein K402DRAFT_466348 [Aulographum hederae CBS 113979]